MQGESFQWSTSAESLTAGTSTARGAVHRLPGAACARDLPTMADAAAPLLEGALSHVVIALMQPMQLLLGLVVCVGCNPANILACHCSHAGDWTVVICLHWRQ